MKTPKRGEYPEIDKMFDELSFASLQRSLDDFRCDCCGNCNEACTC